MKSLFGKIVFYFQAYIKLVFLSDYIETGFYSIAKEDKRYVFKKTKAGLFFIFSKKSKNKKANKFELLITSIECKFIFFVGDYVFSFFKHNQCNLKRFIKMEKYENSICYSINKKTFLKRFVTVESFISSDKLNDDIIVDYILRGGCI